MCLSVCVLLAVLVSLLCDHFSSPLCVRLCVSCLFSVSLFPVETGIVAVSILCLSWKEMLALLFVLLLCGQQRERRFFCCSCGRRRIRKCCFCCLVLRVIPLAAVDIGGCCYGACCGLMHKNIPRSYVKELMQFLFAVSGFCCFWFLLFLVLLLIALLATMVDAAVDSRWA